MSSQYEPTYYDILGVRQDAPTEAIRERYRTLVLKFHPDREGSVIAGEAMAWINQAYKVLSDPQRRHAYDTFLSGRRGRAAQGNTRKRRLQFQPDIPWKIRAGVALAIASCFLAGFLAEPFLGTNVISHQNVGNLRHHFEPIIIGGLVALPTSVPLFGVPWACLAGFMTGVPDRAVLALFIGVSSKASATALEYALLATGLKLGAYYLGICRGFTLIYLVKMWRFNYWDKTFTIGEIVTTVVLGGLAGYFEHKMGVLLP